LKKARKSGRRCEIAPAFPEDRLTSPFPYVDGSYRAAKRRNFQMAVRVEILSRVKHAVDLGAEMTADLHRMSEGAPITESILTAVREYRMALNGALVSARAIEEQPLVDDLQAFSSLLSRISAEIVGGKSLDKRLLGKAIDNLASIETQYVELKLRNLTCPTKGD